MLKKNGSKEWIRRKMKKRNKKLKINKNVRDSY